MHVPVDDRDPFDAVFLLRMPGCDRHVVEQAETHRLVLFGMMPRRAGSDKNIVHLAGHHVIDGRHRTADPCQRRLQAFRPDIGIGLDLVDRLFFRDFAHDTAQMLFRMGEKDQVFIALRGFLAIELLEIGMFQRNRQRAQPVGAFRVAGRCRVFEKDLVFVKARGHG